jgi:hypothetical protein
MEANFDVDPTLSMSKVVENYFQPTPTPPSTSVRPLKIVHKLCAQVTKKKFKPCMETCIYFWHLS